MTSFQWRTLRGTLRHYLGGLRGEPPVYRGHNPLAGIVYTLFFVVGGIQVVTGAGLYVIGEDTLGETWEEIHEIGFWVIVAYMVLHVAMVAAHELTERRGLISAMVHGRKLFARDELDRSPELRSSHKEEV